MNKRKPGSTKPSREEVAQFDGLSIHQLGRLLAAGRLAMKRKLAGRRHIPRSEDKTPEE